MCPADVFRQDVVGKFINYLRRLRSFANKIYVISHNSRGYDTVSAAQVPGNEKGASIGNGQYQNS
jgi:hypothetical protein